MDRAHIVSSIITSDLERYAFKVSKGNDLWKDSISELVISLYEMDEEKLISLFNRGELAPYCYKILWFSFNSESSPFYRKYIKPEQTSELINYDLEFEEVDVEVIRGFINSLEAEISKKRFPSEVRLFELYSELGSYRAVAKKVNLPVMTCFYIIEGFKNEIKKKL